MGAAEETECDGVAVRIAARDGAIVIVVHHPDRDEPLIYRRGGDPDAVATGAEALTHFLADDLFRQTKAPRGALLAFLATAMQAALLLGERGDDPPLRRLLKRKLGLHEDPALNVDPPRWLPISASAITESQQKMTSSTFKPVTDWIARSPPELEVRLEPSRGKLAGLVGFENLRRVLFEGLAVDVRCLRDWVDRYDEQHGESSTPVGDFALALLHDWLTRHYSVALADWTGDPPSVAISAPTPPAREVDPVNAPEPSARSAFAWWRKLSRGRRFLLVAVLMGLLALSVVLVIRSQKPETTSAREQRRQELVEDMRRRVGPSVMQAARYVYEGTTYYGVLRPRGGTGTGHEVLIVAEGPGFILEPIHLEPVPDEVASLGEMESHAVTLAKRSAEEGDTSPDNAVGWVVPKPKESWRIPDSPGIPKVHWGGIISSHLPELQGAHVICDSSESFLDSEKRSCSWAPEMSHEVRSWLVSQVGLPDLESRLSPVLHRWRQKNKSVTDPFVVAPVGVDLQFVLPENWLRDASAHEVSKDERLRISEWNPVAASVEDKTFIGIAADPVRALVELDCEMRKDESASSFVSNLLMSCELTSRVEERCACLRGANAVYLFHQTTPAPTLIGHGGRLVFTEQHAGVSVYDPATSRLERFAVDGKEALTTLRHDTASGELLGCSDRCDGSHYCRPLKLERPLPPDLGPESRHKRWKAGLAVLAPEYCMVAHLRDDAGAWARGDVSPGSDVTFALTVMIPRGESDSCPVRLDRNDAGETLLMQRSGTWDALRQLCDRSFACSDTMVALRTTGSSTPNEWSYQAYVVSDLFDAVMVVRQEGRTGSIEALELSPPAFDDRLEGWDLRDNLPDYHSVRALVSGVRSADSLPSHNFDAGDVPLTAAWCLFGKPAGGWASLEACLREEGPLSDDLTFLQNRLAAKEGVGGAVEVRAGAVEHGATLKPWVLHAVPPMVRHNEPKCP